MDWYTNGADPRAVSELRQEIGAYLARHGSDVDDVSAAELVVAEALSNVARHAPGPMWAALHWTEEKPTLTVWDLGPGFNPDQLRPPAESLLVDDDPEGLDELDALIERIGESGRGLAIIGAIVDRLDIHARQAGGTRVEVRLPVRRSAQVSIDRPRSRRDVLPNLEEADDRGGFGKESFLRALVVQLARTVAEDHGPNDAEAAVAQVGIDVGGQMEAAYRAANGLGDEPLTSDQIGDCLVNLKAAIDGGFRVTEIADGRILLDNTACPFGDVVRRAPALCRMTSSVFGGIAARNATSGVDVVLEERIAVGDLGCRVVIYFDADERPAGAHHYDRPGDATT